jgi:predicted RND superfamily exporter protein
VLSLGLAVMMSAGSLSIVYFGFLTSLAVLAALAADILLLPALLLSWRRQ